MNKLFEDLSDSQKDVINNLIIIFSKMNKDNKRFYDLYQDNLNELFDYKNNKKKTIITKVKNLLYNCKRMTTDKKYPRNLNKFSQDQLFEFIKRIKSAEYKINSKLIEAIIKLGEY